MPKFNSFWTNYTDKVLHFCFDGFTFLVMGSGFYRVVLWLVSLPYFPQTLGAIAVVVVAFGKEFYDMVKSGQSDAFDWRDFGFTIGGGVAMWILFMFLQR